VSRLAVWVQCSGDLIERVEGIMKVSTVEGIMKVSTKGTLFALALSLGVVGYLAFRYSTIAIKEASSVPPQSSEQPLKAMSSAETQGVSSKPAPPPKPSGEPINQPSPEPARALMGTTTEQLEQVERQLPAGSRIATYAISETAQRAALSSSDLSGDGHTETIVVYNSAGTEPIGGGQPLFLAVLSLKEHKSALGSTALLHGGRIYTRFSDKQAVPFAIRDLTGDGRPEIIVTSGVGASLGGWLQVYAFDGSSLHQIANVNGHTLRLNSKGPGKPSEITAKSRYEDKPRNYRWNGHDFEL
jgi:hypothetical protein